MRIKDLYPTNLPEYITVDGEQVVVAAWVIVREDKKDRILPAFRVKNELKVLKGKA